VIQDSRLLEIAAQMLAVDLWINVPVDQQKIGPSVIIGPDSA